jgi:DNA-binding Xre family transcriptional regulator
MIIYNKLGKILKKRNLSWKDLRNAGLSQNMPTRFSKNESISSDTINKVCEYLCVQPSEIMEWIPDAEYAKQSAEIASIEAQIAELEAKKKQLQGK